MKTARAKIGDQIISHNKIKGIVTKINENSVIIDILENNSDLEFPNNKTVISHKHYELLKEQALLH
ncbi:DUF2187 family protein [Mesobacillus foraminis]|uniref:DUF2187 family protein n=1 Tax=Mesobacillus foraminis TaxID=279826 RepID=UPI000EF5520A|nr:DUF2187 family protein [Mesobacillus foraminis]MBT2759004.1 DUF2187 family protein [Mesobacillus foraminis]